MSGDPNHIVHSQHRSSDLGRARCKGTRDGQCRPLDDFSHVYKCYRVSYLYFFTAPGKYNSVLKLWQQATASKHKMPALWRWRLNRPEVYLLLVAIVFASMVADAIRPPRRQLTAQVYIGVVHDYQRYLHPFTHHFVRCRYRPTCSRYSIEAVEKYGLFRGVLLSGRRILSCRSNVPAGTYDPVP